MKPTSIIHALEVRTLNSAPFWMIAPEGEPADAEQVAALKWEAFGLGADDAGGAWMQWPVLEQDGRKLIATAALAIMDEPPGWAGAIPESFEISARLYRIPDNAIAVWKELGQLVAAFMRENHLVHFALLSAVKPDADAAREIRELTLALQAQGFITRSSMVCVWIPVEEIFVQALKNETGIPVRVEAKPAPSLPMPACDIFPPDAARMRAAKSANARQLVMALATAAVFVMFFSVWGGWLFWREKSLAHRTSAIAALRPQVEEIQSLKQSWKSLEPATDADSYPAELFHQIVALLPSEGIRLKEFHLEMDKLVVSGEASSDRHALKFKSDLLAADGLHRYRWNFPQPVNRPDGLASFRAEGLLNIEGGAP